MSHLLLATAFLSCLVIYSSCASAQESSEQCRGHVLGPAPYKLGTVLKAFCIPAPATFDLDTPIQYGAFDSPHEFVLASQRVTSSKSLEPQPLRMMRYDKEAKTWATAELNDLRTEILRGFVGPCLGAAGGVKKVGALYYVSIELSPSAECQVVVSVDLKLKRVLSGWPVASFSSGAVVLQGSMRHFQPTHPLRLSFFEPDGSTLTTIYPATPDPLRAAYIKLLRTGVAQADRCQGEHCEADPEQFGSDLSVLCESAGQCHPAIVVNEKTGSLAFTVEFSPIGFVSFEKLKTSTDWNQQVIYVYRVFLGSVVHRQFRAAEAKAQFGTVSLDELLKPETLGRIFAD